MVLTNNTAELSAIAEAFLHILSTPLNTPIIRICFDSKYASHITRGLWAPKTSKEPVKVLKVLYRKVRQIYTVQWHWIKGHSQVWGNEQADELANKGRTQRTGIGRSSLHQRYDPFLCYVIKVRDTQPPVQTDPITQAIKQAAQDAFPQIPPKAKKPWISNDTLKLIEDQKVARQHQQFQHAGTLHKKKGQKGQEDLARRGIPTRGHRHGEGTVGSSQEHQKRLLPQTHQTQVER